MRAYLPIAEVTKQSKVKRAFRMRRRTNELGLHAALVKSKSSESK